MVGQFTLSVIGGFGAYSTPRDNIPAAPSYPFQDVEMAIVDNSREKISKMDGHEYKGHYLVQPSCVAIGLASFDEHWESQQEPGSDQDAGVAGWVPSAMAQALWDALTALPAAEGWPKPIVVPEEDKENIRAHFVEVMYTPSEPCCPGSTVPEGYMTDGPWEVV